MGPRRAVRDVAASGVVLDALLAPLHVRLLQGAALVDQGRGLNVLDGPLQAPRHFELEQQACPGAPQLQAGDVVTTGTWTDAWPLLAGQTWRAEFDALLGSLEVRLV